MKSNSTKVLILIIICNLGAIAGYYFLFQYIKTQSNAALSLTSTINLSQQKNSHISSLRAVVKDTEGERQQLTAFLLPKDAEVSFIEQIENLAKSSGLSVTTKSVFSAAGNTKAVKIFQMQLETTGSWSNTLIFLSQVESLPYNIQVPGILLNKQPAVGKTAGSVWMATFDLSVTEDNTI